MIKKSKIIFQYFKKDYVNVNNEEENMIIILNNFAKTMNININELSFFYRGKQLKLEFNLKLKDFKSKLIKILVIHSKFKKQLNFEPKQIICPICKNLTLIKLKDDKIAIKDCLEKHNQSNIEINDFIKSQTISEENIKCTECFNPKYLYKNNFLKCSCNNNINICPLCRDKHSKDKQIGYYDYFYKCFKHNASYCSYCEDCHKNLCKECEQQCYKHNIIYYKSIMLPEKKINVIKAEINEAKKTIVNYHKYLEKLKKTLSKKIEKLKKSINDYYKLIDKISFSIDNLINYENIQMSKKLDSFKITKYINSQLKEKIKNHLKIQIDLFDKPNRMEMIYENKTLESKIALFGEEFAKKNKKNCILVINDEIKDFNTTYNIDIKKENLIKVELFEDNIITNMSSLFNNCISLTYIDISDWDMKNVINMSQMFRTCQFLSSIISTTNWDMGNCLDISDIFFECNHLKTLPDISKWNTKNVKNMKNLFKGCKELTSIPDISNWDTKNVINMSYLFSGCKSLLNLPDISKWNISNVTDLSGIFNDCNSLKYLPDISNWNTSKVISMKSMFNKCNSLLKLPDISKWETSNVESYNQMFSDCWQLKELPNIFDNWSISYYSDVSYMFYGCTGLSPHLSEFNKKLSLMKTSKKVKNKSNIILQ